MRILRNGARAVRLVRDQGAAAMWRMLRHQARRALARRFSAHAFLRRRPPPGDLLGMTSREEQAYLSWFTETQYQGRGEIVDLGCWLGSATVSLARGLERNPRVADRAGRIHAYDRFLWEPWMEGFLAGTRLAGRFEAGATFQPEFERRIAPWRGLVRTHAGDLMRERWEPRRPIELLFNDAGKSWDLANHIRASFLPFLEPGLSFLVEQDFAHGFTPWIHLLHYRMRDCFAPVLHVPYSGSMVFRLVRPLPGELVAAPLGAGAFSAAEVEAAFEHALGLVEPPMRPNVWAARVVLAAQTGDLAEADGLCAEGRRRGYAGLDLETVGRLLAARLKGAATETDRAANGGNAGQPSQR